VVHITVQPFSSSKTFSFDLNLSSPVFSAPELHPMTTHDITNQPNNQGQWQGMNNQDGDTEWGVTDNVTHSTVDDMALDIDPTC